MQPSNFFTTYWNIIKNLKMFTFFFLKTLATRKPNKHLSFCHFEENFEPPSLP
jgi:hypothetical protein